jgi:endonuclease/exonuclease/phosphatase family metal-dependent hydrolase
MTALVVMTMNLASGSGTTYVDFTCATHAAFINRLDPDVVFLQEVDRGTARAGRVDQLAVLRDSTKLTDSHFVNWRDVEGGQFGVAIISRLPLQGVENRSVLKPAQWWPWFVRQVVTPLAYARVDVAGAPVDLCATHFPSSDEGRKKYGADELARTIPAAASTVFGGDFNDGPGGGAMAAIDARFTAAESVAPRVVTDDQPVGVTTGDGIIDRGLDHVYLAGAVTCRTWTTLFPVQDGRQFSDHPIAVAELEVPGRPAPLRLPRTAVLPRPVPLDVAVTVTVSVSDDATGAPVAGEVRLDGAPAGAANQPFTATFRRRPVRTFDPGSHRWETEIVDPVLTVVAPGYLDAEVDLGL